MLKDNLCLLVLMCFAKGLFAQSMHNQKGIKPNIVFILTDDMGYETIGYNGAKNIPAFLSQSKERINLRIARDHLSSNSGLTYSDTKITQVNLLRNGKLHRSVKDIDLALTTHRNCERLGETTNPLISFTNEGDGGRIDLGFPSENRSDIVEQEVFAVLTNSDNQSGDRISLYFSLDNAEN